MARPAKKQPPQKFEEPDEAEGWEDAVVDADDKDGGQNLRLRDWRDVERFREMKELRSLVDDDYGLEEIFHIPLKPRAEPGIPVPRTSGKPAKAALPPVLKAVPARPMPAKPVPAKPAAGKAAAKPAHPPARPVHHAKAAPKARAVKKPAKLKAKAKRK